MDCVKPFVVKVRNFRNDNLFKSGQFVDERRFRYVEVPCGVCIACRIAKTREWTARLMMEKEAWDKSGFLTLTYDDDYLPLSACGNMTLVPKHLSDFFKRSRKFLHDHEESSFHGVVLEGESAPLLRYFACGEYGDHTGRPHYHAVVFGFGPEDRERLERLWTFGFVRIDELTPQRCDYCAGYVQKKIFRDPRKYWQEYGCRVWPFQRQSQGLGLSYYLENKSDFEYSDYRIRTHGVSYSMPRFFSKKILNCRLPFQL